MLQKSQTTFSDQDVEKSFEKLNERLRTLLSSQKARECLKNVEAELAFDMEVHLQPLRNDLAECFQLIGDLIHERGTTSQQIQSLIPALTEYMDPGSNLAKDIARIEKEIAEKKRKHPDYIHAFKLQMLVKKFEELMNNASKNSAEYYEYEEKYKKARTTFNNHMQNKIRIAQRAFAPNMLEMAHAQLELARHREKVLCIKQNLLESGRKHSEGTLRTLANVFKDTEPELAETILQQTQSMSSVGDLPDIPDSKRPPQNLAEYREKLKAHNARIHTYDKRLKDCVDQLHQLIEFEEAIFHSYGDQLRERGVQFQKKLKVDKTGTGAGVKYQSASRMSGRRIKK